MKRLIAAFFALAALSALGAQTMTMTIAYEDKEQPPYYMGNTSEVLAVNPGVAVEMVKAVETKIPGLKINLVRAPWKRCTTDLGNDVYDGIFNASYSAQRLAIGWYPTLNDTHDGPVDTSKRIATIAYSLYLPKNSDIAWDGKKFTGLKGDIGAPLGYSVVNDLLALGVGVTEVPGTLNALAMMVNGRLPGAALQDVSADQLLKSFPEKYSSLKKAEIPIVSKPYYLMLSKGFVRAHPDIAKKIWIAIKEIREKDFEKLAAKYGD